MKGMNVIKFHFIVRYTVEDSFIVGKNKLYLTKNVGGSKARRALDFKKWEGGGSGLGALYKFTPMCTNVIDRQTDGIATAKTRASRSHIRVKTSFHSLYMRQREH